MKRDTRRKAGSSQFQYGMSRAAEPRGGEAQTPTLSSHQDRSREHLTKGPSLIGGGGPGGGRDHMGKAPELIGASNWNDQVARETSLQQSDVAKGNAGTNSIANYINISNTATQGNGDFSINTSNKYTNNARGQSRINKEENKGFSDNRITQNSEFANKAQDRAHEKNKGFAMSVTNSFINNAKAHREDNTRKAQEFANQTVSKYLDMNRANQATNTVALDRTIRSQPIIDKAYSKMEGLNTFGDMYTYGRTGLPNFNKGDDAKSPEGPNFQDIYKSFQNDMNSIKIKG